MTWIVSDPLSLSEVQPFLNANMQVVFDSCYVNVIESAANGGKYIVIIGVPTP